MRRIALLLAAALMIPAGATAAGAQSAPAAPPGVSAGVDFLGNIPTDTQSTSINFLSYGQGRNQRNVMITTGRFGARAYDLADPANPRFLSEVSSEALKLPATTEGGRTYPADTAGTFWQSEDTDVDQARKLVFLARDPRAYNGTTTNPLHRAGVYTIDASNPDRMRLLHFTNVGAGHTATCVEGCSFLWVGGPAPNTEQVAKGWTGRPIYVVDMRNLNAPRVLPDQVDLGRDDGRTAYAHDVQVDAAGIAWVSGAGGVRGYYTSGNRWDPVEGRRRIASPANPVPYAGGGISAAGAPTGFMHNSMRAVNASAKDGPRSNFGHRADELILATEEQFSQTNCSTQGKLSISSIRGSYDGEGWRSTPQNPFRLELVSTWSPFNNEGYVETSTFCSAHYFDMKDRVLTYAFYDQGTRFVDISDPTNPIQIGYFRPNATNVWASYWWGDYVYVADHVRGIDILKLNATGKRNQAKRIEVRAPEKSAQAAAFGRSLKSQFAPDPLLGYGCMIPKP